MSRGLAPLLAGVALIVVLIAGLATRFNVSGAQQSGTLAQAETPVTTSSPTGQPGTSPAAQFLPPELSFLAGMTPQQRFDHMLPGQTSFLNPQGQTVVVNTTPGQISAISGNSVSVTVNGPAPAQTRTFTITPTTWVHAMPARGNLQALATGDRVVVYTIGNSTDATAIVKSRTSMMPSGGWMGGGHHMTDDES